MKTYHVLFFSLLFCLLAPADSFAKLRIFACEPEWRALAQEIGGDKVKAFSATSAKQDPHYIRARPSLISKARKAKLMICSGAGLEAGWLPVLLQKAGGGLQPGTPGYMMAGDLVNLLEVPVLVDRSMGDVHPQGNPHVHLDPNNLILLARSLADRLSVIDSANASYYESRYESFSSRLGEAISRWEADLEGIKGKRVVTHHKSFSYLIDWLGLERAATLEPKPGIPPTTSHLKKLLTLLRSNPAIVIIRSPYAPDDASEWLSEKTGIRAMVLPYTVGGDKDSGDLFALFDKTVALLKEANGDGG